MKRTIKTFIILLFSGMILLLPLGLLANQDETPGLISGRLINFTTGEKVSGVEVILQKYEGRQEQGKEKAVSDASGKFLFSQLDRHKKYRYVLQVMYKGVEYYNPPLVFSDQKEALSFDVTVYDTTDSDEKISVIMHHVITGQKDGFLVKEVMIVENRGNHAFVGSHEVAPNKKETLRVTLPPGAQELKLLHGLMKCCVVNISDGFVDTMEIRPGKKKYSFAYKINYGFSGIDLRKKINLRTSSLNFFIPNQGIRAKGENIEYVGLVGKPERQFLHFESKDIPEGSQVSLKLKGLPWAKKFSKKIVPFLLVLFMILGLIYPFIRRRKKHGGTEIKAGSQVDKEPPLQKERQDILLAIAELDDQLESGQISPEEHSKRRHILKEQAIKITKTLHSESNKKSDEK